MSEYLIDAITKDTRYITGYANGTVFGMRDLPELGMYNNYHIGNDYNLPEGTKLYMPADGEFVATCRDGYGNGYGNYILVNLPQESGGITIHLGHLNHIEWYEGKGIIKKGTYIGNSGNTGDSTGPHLHLGVAPGVKRDTIKGTYGDRTWIDPSSVMIKGTPVASKPSAPSKPAQDLSGLTLVPEEGYYFYPDRTINIRSYPSTTKGDILGKYYEGEYVDYEGYVVNEGGIWLYYTKDGKKRFVYSRPNGGKIWGYFA